MSAEIGSQERNRNRIQTNESWPSCRGCGEKAEGEVFNFQGGLVACCQECGQRIPGGFTKWSHSESIKK